MTIAFITGANKGIGYATAAALGRAGLRVVIGARDRAKGEAAAAALREQGADAVALEIDVADDRSVRAAAEALRGEHGRVDVLVNNAGVLPEAAAAHRVTGPMDVAIFRETFATNLFGVVATTQAFLPLLLAAPGGRIVNVSSTMGSLADQSDPDVVLPRPRRPGLPGVQGGAELDHHRPLEVAGRQQGEGQRGLPGLGADRPRRSPEQGRGADDAADAARVVAELALIGENGPTGGFFDSEGPVRW